MSLVQALGDRGYLARTATITSACRLLGSISGIVLDSAVLSLFGVGAQTDSHFAALTVPLLITSTLSVQLPKVLVPAFSKEQEAGGAEALSQLLGNVLAVGGLILLIVSVILTAGSAWLVPLQAPGLDRASLEVATRLGMIVSWLVVVQGTGFIIGAALNAAHKYLATSLSTLVTNFVTLLTCAFLFRSIGIYALSLGLLLGACCQFLQLFTVLRLGGLAIKRLNLKDERSWSLLRLCFNPVVGHAVGESKVIFENVVGSFLGSGMLSIVRYANRIVESVTGMLVGGLVTGALPMVSYYTAKADHDGMKRSILKAIQLISIVATPICLWLVFGGNALIALMFERGRFSPESTRLVAILVALLAPYVLLSRISGIAQVPFYAVGETRTPLFSTVIYLASYITICVALIPILGVAAFPTSTSVASAATAVAMLWLMRRRFGPFPWADLFEYGRRLTLVAVLTSVGLLMGTWLAPVVSGDSLYSKSVRLAIITAIGAISFCAGSIGVGLVDFKRALASIFDTPVRSKVAEGAPR
jgi:putative peptidoglycan lipid II flippase